MEDSSSSRRDGRKDDYYKDEDAYGERSSGKKPRHRSQSIESDDGRRRRRQDGVRRRDRDERFEDDERDSRRRNRDREDREDRRRSYHRRDHSRSEDDDARDPRRDRRHRHRSRSKERHQKDRRSRSPPHKRRRSRSKSPSRRSKAPLPSQDESFRGDMAPGERPPEKQKPNFKPTGLLAKEANTVAGTTTVLKYHEPAEARKPPPKEQWRMYIFKGKDLLDTIYIHQRSAWLMGRDQKVTDLLLEHPSISKQHAVIQFRYITTTNEYGDKISKVKPYLIDLESKKGTTLNGKQIEASRFVELVDQDVMTFGDSEREYVLMLPSAEK